MESALPVILVSPVRDVMNERLNLNTPLRARPTNDVVDRVYSTGLTAAFNGRMKTAIQAKTCNQRNPLSVMSKRWVKFYSFGISSYF